MGAEEKRAHERLIVRYPVQLVLDGGKRIAGTVENLGALGALISTIELEPNIDVGEKLDLAIDMADRGTVEVAGEVLRAEQEFAEGEIRRSFAIKFAHALPDA